MAVDFARTVDDFEMQFGANHVGHFLLVNRLAPLLKARAPSRLVVMSSGAHRLHDVDLGDPNFQHKAYDRWDAYGQSKSANALFALAFDRRHRDEGVRAFTVAPGIIIDTNLHHHLTQEDFAPLRQRQPEVANLPRKRLTVGAATIVWALVHPELDGQGGRFLEDCGFSEVNPDPRLPNGVIPWVLDADHAEAVWALSERLVGESFARPGAGPQMSLAAPPPRQRWRAGCRSTGEPARTNCAAGRWRSSWTRKRRPLSRSCPTAFCGGVDCRDLRWTKPAAAVQSMWSRPHPMCFSSSRCCLRKVARRWPSSSTNRPTTRCSSLPVSARTAGPSREKPGVSQRFTRGRVRGAQAPSQLPPPMPTRDLIGTRAIYRYSEDTVYEHIYLNTRWYSYQCLKGVRRGDCGTDETSYWKIRDDVYVITWREILIDLAATFVYDMTACRSTGCAWARPANSRNRAIS